MSMSTSISGGAVPVAAQGWRLVAVSAALVVAAAGCQGATPCPRPGLPTTSDSSQQPQAAAPARAWSPAQILEDDHAGMDDHPSVAINAAGNGVVAWQRDFELWVRMYDGASGTFGPAWLVTVPSRYDDLQVGIDGQGNVLLVWARDDAGAEGIWWSRSTDGGVSWSVAAPVALGKLRRTRLAVSPGGIALAAWTSRSADDVIANVGSCDFRDGRWSPAVNVPLPGMGFGDRNPRVALDDDGRGFLIWEQPAELNGKTRIWTERYDGGWLPESVAILDTYGVDDSYTPTIALNEKGGGTAIWLEVWTHGAPQLWARRFDGRAWSQTERLTGAPLIEWDPPPREAIDPAGGSVAIWSEVTSLPENYQVHAARFSAGAAGWQAPASLETNNLIGEDLTQYAEPLVGMDVEGNAIATWRKQQPSAQIQVFSAQLAAGSNAWIPPDGAPVHADAVHSAFATDLAVARDGTAISAWSYGPEYDIWACVYR
jgi:hypothetical protein